MYIKHFHFIQKQIESHSFYLYMKYTRTNSKLCKRTNPFEWWIRWTVFSHSLYFFLFSFHQRSFSFRVLIAFCAFWWSPFFRVLYLFSTNCNGFLFLSHAQCTWEKKKVNETYTFPSSPIFVFVFLLSIHIESTTQFPSISYNINCRMNNFVNASKSLLKIMNKHPLFGMFKNKNKNKLLFILFICWLLLEKILLRDMLMTCVEFKRSASNRNGWHGAKKREEMLILNTIWVFLLFTPNSFYSSFFSFEMFE